MWMSVSMVGSEVTIRKKAGGMLWMATCWNQLRAQQWQKSSGGDSGTSWEVSRELTIDHHHCDAREIQCALSMNIMCPSSLFDPKHKPGDASTWGSAAFFPCIWKRGKARLKTPLLLIPTLAVPSCLCCPCKALGLKHRSCALLCALIKHQPSL